MRTALAIVSAFLGFAALPAWAEGNGRPLSSSHNPNHPQSELLTRSITSDASHYDGTSFDFIIVGGGLAGLAVAARLSEWSNITVLVIEAGGDGSEFETQIDVPGYSYVHSLTNTPYDWNYTTEAQTDLNLAKSWPRGKGLGGSGAINGMFWCRASSTEYDAWATLNPNGDQTWDWAEVDKYIMKAENFTAPSADVQTEFSMVFNESAHGSGGPIQAGLSEYIFPLNSLWIPSWETLGFTAKDLASGDNHGVMITPSTLNSHNGSRSDSKAGYIDPLPPRSNLVIITGQQVTEIIFNGTTDSSGNIIASGVKFQASESAASYSVQANKEVILSSGTVGSPQLLQLSGIGPTATLQAVNIDVLVDLPVGYNLQDHVSYSMYWETPTGTLTWVNLTSNDTLQAEMLTEWEESGTGMWTYINEAVGYVSLADIIGSSSAATTFASAIDINTTVSDVSSWFSIPSTVATGLTAQYNIMQQWLEEDIGQLEIILTLWGDGADSLGIQVALQHPWSRGTLLINSSSAFDKPVINPDYFGVNYDLEIINYGSLWTRTLAAAAPLSTYMITEQLPGATVTGDALSNYTMQSCGTEYHPVGTCAMLPQASGGVVDTNLMVYGTSNLRVIDASIIPLEISAHLMATTYGIAEKGADIVKAAHMLAIASTTENTTTTASETTASIGVATDTSVTEANSDVATGLSTTAKTGIAVGVAVGAVAILGALILFFCLRRKRNAKKPVQEKGWYNPGANDGTWDAQQAYKEQADTYPMANFEGPGGVAAAGFRHERNFSHSPSVSTMATADLAGHPMRTESGFGLSSIAGAGGRHVDSDYQLGDYQRGGATSPYRDYEDDGFGGSTPSGYRTPGGGFVDHAGAYSSEYPQQGLGQQEFHAPRPMAPPQHYTPVQPR